MNCEDVTDDMLLDHLRGEMTDPVARDDVAAHIGACPHCRDRAGQLEAITGAMADLLPDPGALSGVDAAMAGIIADAAQDARRREGEEPPFSTAAPKPGLFWMAAAVAASLLLAMAGFWAGATFGPLRSAGLEEGTRVDPDAPARDAFRQKKAELEATVTSLERDLHEAKADMARWQASARDKEGQAEAAVDKLERTNRALAGLRIAVEEMQAAVGAETALRKQALEEKEKLADRLAEIELSLKASAGRGDALRLRVQRLEEENTSLTQTLVAAQADVSALIDRNERLETRLLVKGDVNGDGHADVADAMAICAARTRGDDRAVDAGGDMNGDGRVDVADALLISRMAVLGR